MTARIRTMVIDLPVEAPQDPPALICLIREADRHSVPRSLMLGMALQESDLRHVARRNRNNTYDLGLAQVNSVHIPAIAKASGTSTGDVIKSLVRRPCSSIAAGAWILGGCLKRRASIKDALSCYHSPANAARGERYADRVLARIGLLKARGIDRLINGINADALMASPSGSRHP